MRQLTMAATVLAAVLLAAAPASAQVPPGAKWQEHYVPSRDGTKLHVDLLLPADREPGERLGVVLVATSYGAHSGSMGAGFPFDPLRDGPVHTSRQITETQPWRRGMAVAYADMRGYGASEGCIDFGGDADRADTFALIDWAAAQEWSNGRVVLAGLSYAAIPPLLALADPPRALRGIVPLSGLGSMYGGPYTNGVHRELASYPVPLFYDYTAAEPGSGADDARYHEGWARGLRPDCLARHDREQLDPEPSSPYWRERDWGQLARGARVPVLAAQGLRDPAVSPDNFLAWWGGMDGWRAAWLGQYPHGSPRPELTGREGFADQFARFLEATLSGADLPDADRGVVVQEAPSGRWRREDRWPPKTDAATLRVLAGTYEDVPGNRAEPVDPVRSATEDFDPQALNPQPLAAREGIGSWTFSPPLDRELHLAGEPELDLGAAGPAGANVIALLYDVAPDGKALLVSRGAARLGGNGARIALYPQDWRLEPGHRLGLLITGSDELWWSPQSRSLAAIRVTAGALRVPALPATRDTFVPGGRGPELDRHRPITVPVDPATRTGRFER